MVYSDSQIKDAIAKGEIVVHPYIEEHVRGSSVDVTLGEWYYPTELAATRDFYNPFSQDDVAKYFGKPQRAVTHREWCTAQRRLLFEGIPEDQLIIVLGPGQRILAHSHEFIGIKASSGTTEMRSRSSWGRNGIAACFDAGWGDPGFINRWTMEIFNLNQHASVPVPVGERIAQIIFHKTGPVNLDYGSKGKYQGQEDIMALVKKWKPEMMLPKSYTDERISPLPI